MLDSRPMGQAAKDSESAELPFEGALERLEELVEHLEAGELPLDEALTVFEEGVRLSRRCAQQLEDAERRIEALVDGGATAPFPVGGDDPAVGGDDSADDD